MSKRNTFSWNIYIWCHILTVAAGIRSTKTPPSTLVPARGWNGDGTELYITPAIGAWILHVYIKNHRLQFYVKKVGKTCTSCECVRACVSEYRTIKNKKVYHPWHTWIVIIQRERDGTVRNRVVVRSCIRSFVSMYILIDIYIYIYISVYIKVVYGTSST